MLENSLIKILTSICFCEERGKGGRGGRKMEDGKMEAGRGRLRDINCPIDFWGDCPELRLVQIEF